MSDDYSANVQTTGAVAVGGSATGVIETAYDQDWFAVELEAGRTYQFDLGGSPSGGGTLSDTFLRAIYDSEGRYQSDSYNDDFGGSRDSRVTFTASQSGTYYVRASGDRDETGSYTLRVSDVTPGPVEDPPPVEPPAETVASEEPARAAAEDLGNITELAAPRFPLGTLDGGGDTVAWYRFTLSEAREVALGLRRQDADADLVLEDAAGNVLHSSERSGTTNEWLRETLLAGTYYVRVEAQEAGANAYVFRYGVGDADPAEVTRLEAEQESVQEQVQQQPPAFGSQFYGFDLPENTDGSANRISLGTVSAVDPEGDTLTYSIEGGNAAGLFEIDAASGELFYTGGGEDYETGSTSFELTVRASDGDQTTDTTATVNVTDVDEPVEGNPPVAQPDQSTPQTVSEPSGEDFSAGASTSGRVAVGDTATGNIGSNGDRDWFAVELVAGRTYVIDLRGSRTDDGTLSDPYLGGIHDSDGNLIPRTTNDDGGQGYNSRVTFTATESGTHYIAAGAYSGQGTYEVEVTDTSPPIVAPDPDSEEPPDPQEQVQQQPPAFGSQFYGFELPENTDGSADRISLGTVSATDPDGGSVTYSIEGGNAAGLFEIDAASGELFYTGGGEDYETGSTSFELTVRASDGDQTTDTTATVSVTDVAEAPAFGQAGYGFDLAENADGSTNRISLGTVSATDPDGGSVTYSIEGGSAAGLFEIDAASGELFYTGGGEDYETGSTSFELTVRASDGDQTTDTTATVSVTDVAEAPAFGQAGYGFDLAENTDGSADRISLGTVSATDPDGGSVTYSIEGGNAAGLFEIDAAGGELFYTGGGEDYETGFTRFELTVRASDGDQTTDTTVAVNVTDVDDPVEVDPPVAQPDQSTPQTVSEPAGEDFSAGTSTSGRVAGGDTATGNIGSNGDRDWFAVELVAGRTYVIDLRGSSTDDGTLSDPYLRGIHDSDGNLIPRTTNDDGGQGYNSRVTFTATESGTHYIAAGAYSGQGTYEVEVTDTPRTIEDDLPATIGDDLPTTVEDDFPATVDTTGTVEVGGSATGEIESADDHDWFAVELEAGKTYQIDTGGVRTGGGTLPSGRLHGVYDADGNRIPGVYDRSTVHVGRVRVDDDQVFFTPDEDGTYYVAASNGEFTSTGAYTVRVTEMEDDFPSTVDTTGTVEIGGTATGEIQYQGDGDWFAVELAAGQGYHIDLKGRSTNDGTLYSPYLSGIYDAEGNQIPGTVDRVAGSGKNSRVHFTAETDGTYYIAAASAYNTSLGTYEVRVWEDDFSGDRRGTTGTVEVGGSATGEIQYQSDSDLFAVELEAGKTYQIDVGGAISGGGTLPFGRLYRVYDTDGYWLQGVSDPITIQGFAWGPHPVEHYEDEQVFFTPDEDGTYYLAVGDPSRGATGTYTVRVTEIEDDFPQTVDTTGTVEVGGTATGEMQYETDRDWFAVELTAGETYKVELLGGRGKGGTLQDPYIRGIHDGDGRSIYGTTDYASGPHSNSEVLFTPDEDGTYYIAAGSFMSGDREEDVGTYTLQVSIDDFRDDTDTTGTVAVGDSVTGEIEAQGDQDWFAVTLEAGKTYQIDMEGSETDGGTLENPFLHTMRDANGDVLRIVHDSGGWSQNVWTSDQDSGEGLNSRVTFTPDEDGTYYLVAASGGHMHTDDSHGRSLGTYTLSVEELIDAI